MSIAPVIDYSVIFLHKPVGLSYISDSFDYRALFRMNNNKYPEGHPSGIVFSGITCRKNIYHTCLQLNYTPFFAMSYIDLEGLFHSGCCQKYYKLEHATYATVQKLP